jgi:hypothetical protein
MAAVEKFTDPYLHSFTLVPPVAAGVCDVCHGAPNPGYARCHSCALTTSQVSHPVTRVVPITLYVPMSPMHTLLRSYKDGPPSVQRRLRPRLGALLTRFLSHHTACIGRWDTVTIVPSSRGRADPHPLERVVRMDTRHASVYRGLLRPGSYHAQHRHGSDHAFDMQEAVAGRQVLLIDDTFTSGAEVQSAASALHLHGASVTAVVVIGRYLDPDFSDNVRALWDRARTGPFDFTRCCLCDQPW